mgnify:CR=1 FL=1
MESSVYETNLSSLPLLGRGKVRDIYDINSDKLLIVATDRLSAFDVVFPQAVPYKGKILTGLSNFWFQKMRRIIPNHLTGLAVSEFLESPSELEIVKERAVVVRKLRPLPIEAVVRGYVAGSGWEDYLKSGGISGVKLKQGLNLAEKLDTPIFTPSTKAKIGSHDENIDYEEACDLIGDELAGRIRAVSLEIYDAAAKYALNKGIIIADTKMEFGLSSEDELVLIDELLTPDSSRFWPKSSYEVGVSPESFDKQFVRDYLQSVGWNKSPPIPKLPREIIEKTFSRYEMAHNLLV